MSTTASSTKTADSSAQSLANAIIRFCVGTSILSRITRRLNSVDFIAVYATRMSISSSTFFAVPNCQKLHRELDGPLNASSNIATCARRTHRDLGYSSSPFVMTSTSTTPSTPTYSIFRESRSCTLSTKQLDSKLLAGLQRYLQNRCGEHFGPVGSTFTSDHPT